MSGKYGNSEIGRMKIEWARSHMSVLSQLSKEFSKKKPLNDVAVGMAMHVEAKTAVLALSLKEAGAKVFLAGCNPLSTDDDVAGALNEIYGIETYGHKGETEEEYYGALNKVVDKRPQIIVDDGADLVTILHTKRKSELDDVIGATEETTTGVVRLKAMESSGALKIPVIDVNDAQMKHLFDNRYGTGQSVFDGIFTATNLLVAGKTVVVASYGWCGRGIAMRADGLGAKVIVTEIDHVKAVEAVMDGFQVMPMKKAAQQADFIITATGVKDILRKEYFSKIKDGCVLANAGHFNVEVRPEMLKRISKKVERVRSSVDAYQLKNGKTVYLLAEGRLVNLAAGQGHPVEIMDMSFALQYISAIHLWKFRGKLNHGVHHVPEDIDMKVAELKLETMGVKIDKLTDAQKKYVSSWKEGT